MIELILQWLQLQNLSVAVEARSANNAILLAYIISFKRSWLFAMAFILCAIASNTGMLGLVDVIIGLGAGGSVDWMIVNLDYDRVTAERALYGLFSFLAVAFAWCVTVKSQINHTQNKSLAFWSSIMISFLLLMAWDSVANAETETYIYSNYEAIIVCIHFCIILSLYNIRASIYNLVSKLCSAISIIRSGYAMQFICYNAFKYKL